MAWGAPSLTSQVHGLAQNECPNEGFRGSVWCLPYTSWLTSTGTITSTRISTSSLGKVAADICFHSGQTLLVVVNYFSNFIEVDFLSSETFKSVIRSLMATFSQFGVPDTLVMDNGPCFASPEFVKFVDKWNFQHVTSSPHYLQSNGKAENAVHTVKSLSMKCWVAGVGEFQALLDWCNTLSDGMDTSPAQRLSGCCCKTSLPTSGSLLGPEFSFVNDAAKLCTRKEHQCRYFNLRKCVLCPVKAGETIHICSHTGTWKPAECLREVATWSYEALVDGAVRHRNWKDIWQTAEQQNVQTSEEVEPFAEVQSQALCQC